MYTTETKATLVVGMAGSEVTLRTKQEDGGFSELKLPPDFAKRLGKRLVAVADILLGEKEGEK